MFSFVNLNVTKIPYTLYRYLTNIRKINNNYYFFCVYYSKLWKFGENYTEARDSFHTRRVVRMEFRKSIRRYRVGQLRRFSRRHYQL